MIDIIKHQLELYPDLQVKDLFKALYQAVFGCGHFVGDIEKCKRLLFDELKEIKNEEAKAAEPLGEYCRVHLSSLSYLGISPKTLLKLFILSARKTDKMDEYIKILDTLPLLCTRGILPFDESNIKKEVDEQKKMGCPPLRHSEYFREKYHPAYRVIRSDLVSLIPVLNIIESLSARSNKNLIIAIDGDCGSGKSTLGSYLEKYFPATLLHMDDYFLPPEKKTRERLSLPGGNVDHERFLSEVLKPLSRGEAFVSRPYRCHGGFYEDAVTLSPMGITVVEGSYSLHPELEGYYDLKILLSCDKDVQIARIKKRSPEMLERFLSEWIPLEKNYFEKTNIYDRCDINLISKESFVYEIISNRTE